MEVRTGVSIHNRFDIVVRDAVTEEIIQIGKAENIIVNEAYERLTNFQSYFDYILFGSSDVEPSATKNTLGTQLGYKAAERHSLVRAFPTSIWTKKIRLGTNEYNEQYIREVGISHTTSSINTHALIIDSEDKPLEIEKTSTRIIDMYATVYIKIYDVDWGLMWDGTGLRDYLTGASMAADKMVVTGSGNWDENIESGGGVTATKTRDKSAKWTKISIEFNEQYWNKDIKYVHWVNGGLRVTFPRTGVFADYQRNDVPIGKGDGNEKIFILPNKKISELVIKVDGVVEAGVVYDGWDKIEFNIAPDNNKPITANYKCGYIPKDEDHILKVHFKIQFGAGQPTAVMPDIVFPQGLPGVSEIIAGTNNLGYFGVVSADDLITGEDLCTYLNLTAGTKQFSDAGWLKYVDGDKILYVAKKTIRYNVSWDNINAVGAVWGDAKIKIGNINYKIRLLSSSEWNKLIYPVHKDHYGGASIWDNFADTDIQVNYSVSGNGCYTWTSTPSGSSRVYRGYSSVSYSGSSSPSGARDVYGFRPVLEVL